MIISLFNSFHIDSLLSSSKKLKTIIVLSIISLYSANTLTEENSPELLKGDVIDMAIVMSGFKPEKIQYTSQCLEQDFSVFEDILERASKICRGNENQRVSSQEIAAITDQFVSCIKQQLTVVFSISEEQLMACIPAPTPEISLIEDDEYFDDLDE